MNSLSSFRALDSVKSFGIELECYMSNPPSEGYYGFFYKTSDASICPPRWGYAGVEWVSQPLPKQWLQKELVKLGKKYAWESNDSCGIHVHVNKQWCTKKKALAIYKFMKENRHLAEYWYGRKDNSYCRLMYDNPTDTRYSAVNICDKTVEFRSFKSGTINWASYCLDLVEYLVENAFRLNVDAMDAAVDMFKAKHHIV